MKLRGTIYWIDIWPKGMDRLRESLGTGDKRQARVRYEARVNEYRRGAKRQVGERNARRGELRMWTEASNRWREERAYKRTADGDRRMLEVIDEVWTDMPLADINYDVLKAFKAGKASGEYGGRRTKDDKPMPCKPGTVNRWMLLISAVLRASEREWGWIARAPSVKLERVQARKIRFLTRAEAERVLEHLSPCYRDLMKLSLTTGMRQANVCRLEWGQVNLEEAQVILDADAVKNGEELAIPINAEAVAILKRYVGLHAVRVFVNARGQTFSRPQPREWKVALEKSGVGALRWHDLRHTWASWMRQAGTPDAAVQELGGWKDPTMLRKYAHFDQDSLRQYVGGSSLAFSGSNRSASIRSDGV